MLGLVGSLSTNKKVQDAIRGKHFETDVRQNDIDLILLALFVP